MTLPLGPMTSPILSIGISKDTIFGALSATSVTRLGDRGGHDLEDGQAGLLGLVQRLGQHVGRETVDLGVELERGDRVGRAGHLEVHVAEGVLGAQDVGQGDVGVALVVDEAHGDTRHRRLDRHAGRHQRERRAADRGHRGRAVGGQDVGDHAQGVGEVLLARGPREQGPLGQQAVADLAALGAAHEAGLAGRVRREVVVVHVALGLDRGDRVEQLVHPGHAERGHVEHLGLATLEQRRAVGGREQVDLGREGPDVGGAPAVDPHALLDDALGAPASW